MFRPKYVVLLATAAFGANVGSWFNTLGGRITLVSELLRDELTACREEGLWDIRLA